MVYYLKKSNYKVIAKIPNPRDTSSIPHVDLNSLIKIING
jgi:hypothetical protein